jgi:hypothetical protein
MKDTGMNQFVAHPSVYSVFVTSTVWKVLAGKFLECIAVRIETSPQ